MKCKKITIETDGTTAGTKIFADGKQLGRVRRADFSAGDKPPQALRSQVAGNSFFIQLCHRTSYMCRDL